MNFLDQSILLKQGFPFQIKQEVNGLKQAETIWTPSAILQAQEQNSLQDLI